MSAFNLTLTFIWDITLFFSDINISVYYKFFPHLKIPLYKYNPFFKLFMPSKNYIPEDYNYIPTQVQDRAQMSERTKIKYTNEIQNAECWRTQVLILVSEGHLFSDDFWLGVDSPEWHVTKENLRAWTKFVFQANIDLYEHETNSIILARVDVIESAYFWSRNPGSRFFLDGYEIRRKAFSELSMQSKYVNIKRNYLETEETLERFRIYVELNNVFPQE
jgi:hypothetical protein